MVLQSLFVYLFCHCRSTVPCEDEFMIETLDSFGPWLDYIVHPTSDGSEYTCCMCPPSWRRLCGDRFQVWQSGMVESCSPLVTVKNIGNYDVDTRESSVHS